VLAQQHGLQPRLAGGAGQRLVAHVARDFLRALAERVPRMHAPHLQRHAERLAGGAAMPLEGVGRLLQPMVHVDGLHLAGPAARRSQQQHGGIGAAAVCDGQGQRQLQARERLGRGIAVGLRRIRPWCR